MTITSKFEPYAGTHFYSEDGKYIHLSAFTDKLLEYEGRKGKIKFSHRENIYEHGFSGYQDNYHFIYQDDLTTKSLSGKMVFKVL